ncbi:MAG: DUF488 family protein [Betaproteobacteria bacterium]
MDVLYTVGYEGARLNDFVEQLKELHIQLVVDVREKAWSRKPGFSKTSLNTALARRGIKYIHVPELGSPSSIRRQLHEDGDYRRFFAEYRRYLLNHSDVADGLVEDLENETACLMCFERDPNTCHRKVIAEYLTSIAGLMKEVQHIDGCPPGMGA